jgi:exopolyphosphatase/guanosine-5'-triphosphate,3'-diphosphate pyrophosphatase
MRLAVIDVGSNTARLLVVDVRRDGRLAVVAEDRAFLELGAEPGADRAKLAELGRVARRFVSRARKLRTDAIETIVTAPGRRRDGEAIVQVLRDAKGGAVRVLTAEEEGCLAYAGAIAGADDLPEVVAVVDVGGGSSEIAIGTPWFGASWVRSLELGSLGLTRMYLTGDPPTSREVSQARDAVRLQLTQIEPPWVDTAFATGGSARAIAKIVGAKYTSVELDALVDALASHRTGAIPELFGINPRRAGTILAGAILLAELSRHLGRPLEIAQGGLREGALLALAADEAARAAA